MVLVTVAKHRVMMAMMVRRSKSATRVSRISNGWDIGVDFAGNFDRSMFINH